MAKSNKVEVQKGEFKVAEPTYKFCTTAQRLAEDNKNMMMRRDCQTMTFHEPKK